MITVAYCPKCNIKWAVQLARNKYLLPGLINPYCRTPNCEELLQEKQIEEGAAPAAPST